MSNSISERRNRTTGVETALWLGKIMFLVIGIVSTAILTYKFAVPYVLYLLSESLPRLWNSVVAGILPCYLFITVHFLIFVVWKLHGLQRPDAHDQDKPPYSSLDSLPSVNSKPITRLDSASVDDLKPLDEDMVGETEPCSVMEENSDDKLSDPSGDVDMTRSMEQVPWPPPEEEEEVELVEEESVSMNAIWKAITGGELSASKNQHLIKKSDTWEKSKAATTPTPTPTLTRSSATGAKEMRKSETFREKVKATATSVMKKDMRKSETFRESSSPASTAGWRGRDRLLLVQDELFSKVEAFIKMNKDQMRVKRQEPDHRYVEMVNAAY